MHSGSLCLKTPFYSQLIASRKKCIPFDLRRDFYSIQLHQPSEATATCLSLVHSTYSSVIECNINSPTLPCMSRKITRYPAMMMDHSVCSNCIIYRLKSDRCLLIVCIFNLIATLSIVKFNTQFWMTIQILILYWINDRVTKSKEVNLQFLDAFYSTTKCTSRLNLLQLPLQ